MSRRVSLVKLFTADIRDSDIKNLRGQVRISNWMFLLLLAAYRNDMSHKPCFAELFSHGKL